MWVVRVTSGGCFGRKNKDPSQVEREMAADLELEREREMSHVVLLCGGDHFWFGYVFIYKNNQNKNL